MDGGFAAFVPLVPLVMIIIGIFLYYVYKGYKQGDTEKLDEELRKTYAKWTTEELKHAITEGRKDYEDDALSLMEKELRKRGVIDNSKTLDISTSKISLKANRKIVEARVCNICSGRFSIGEDIEKCEKCGSFYHPKCWEKNEGCNQPGCREDTKLCPVCGKMIKKTALKCRYCGSLVDVSMREHLGPMNDELKHYLVKASGTSRTGLNVMAGIGVFIFGWLIAVVFSSLGKGGRGWAYLIPYFILITAGRSEVPALAALGLVIYIAGWVDANLVLSRYQSGARDRIAKIDHYGSIGADMLLEKGILLHKVLGEKQLAVDVLKGAIRTPGGDPYFLNIAGVVMVANKQYREAVEFFDRALARTNREDLIKQIKKNRSTAEKKIR